MNNACRITKVSVGPLRAPLIQPFRVATGEHHSLDNLLLTLTLADGTCGYGEAAIATHITGETIAITYKNLKQLSSRLTGLCASDYLEISTDLHDQLAQNPCAIAAVEMALFDVLAQRMRMPLWRLWTDKPKHLRTDITIVIAGLEETKDTARRFYQQGFRAFKIKIGRDMDLDFQRVQAVRSAVRGSPIILDANQGYTARQTLQFLKILEKAGIAVELIEQPVAKADWDGLKRVASSSKVCVCADESVSTLAQAMRIIKEKACGAINIKLMKTGLVHALEISRWARANGIKLMIGGMMESNLAMTASAHLAAGMGCFDFIDLDTPFFIKGEVRRNPFLSTDGIYDLSRVKAGIGIGPPQVSFPRKQGSLMR